MVDSSAFKAVKESNNGEGPYGKEQSIKRKVNTTEKAMRDQIMFSFYHCSSSDDKHNHELCPKGKDSWCFYQAALAKGEMPPSHSEMKFFSPSYLSSWN
ncbi:hypothetical protein E2C01_032090 [Portunus trituberculatus]|uniref:Uncharacterized protein n=1 Tax=Portunus trituberculatus TaxID=210409 RepID=A0A5B7EWK6_PORTR|nr:hypothetical protein [Portunus trituberculatus]